MSHSECIHTTHSVHSHCSVLSLSVCGVGMCCVEVELSKFHGNISPPTLGHSGSTIDCGCYVAPDLLLFLSLSLSLPLSLPLCQLCVSWGTHCSIRTNLISFITLRVRCLCPLLTGSSYHKKLLQNVDKALQLRRCSLSILLELYCSWHSVMPLTLALFQLEEKSWWFGIWERKCDSCFVVVGDTFQL